MRFCGTTFLSVLRRFERDVQRCGLSESLLQRPRVGRGLYRMLILPAIRTPHIGIHYKPAAQQKQDYLDVIIPICTEYLRFRHRATEAAQEYFELHVSDVPGALDVSDDSEPDDCTSNDQAASSKPFIWEKL